MFNNAAGDFVSRPGAGQPGLQPHLSCAGMPYHIARDTVMRHPEVRHPDAICRLAVISRDKIAADADNAGEQTFHAFGAGRVIDDAHAQYRAAIHLGRRDQVVTLGIGLLGQLADSHRPAAGAQGVLLKRLLLARYRPLRAGKRMTDSPLCPLGAGSESGWV